MGIANSAITVIRSGKTLHVKVFGIGWMRFPVACAGTVDGGASVRHVADSVPASEFQETLNKARGMLKALACLA